MRVARGLPAALLLAAAAGCANPTSGRTAANARPAGGCLADLDEARVTVAADYAGYADRSRGRGAELIALTDSLRAEARTDGAGGGCGAAIQRWLDFFADPHLYAYGGPTAPRERARPRPGALAGARERWTPGLSFPDDSTALLRLPSFELEHAAAIDSLVAASRERLLATPYLVVDVRRNGGGWSGAYAGLLPLLQTGPIRVHGWDVWSSPRNAAEMRASLAYPAIPETLARQIREALPRMEAAPGEFVTLEEDHDLQLGAVHPFPRAVAVLVDRRCASGCEQFVLDARQSARVTVFGAEPTRGALEYAGVRTVRLPSGRELSLPTTRSHWALAHPGETRGIAPDVRVPADESDLVAFARRHLATLDPRP